MKTNIIIGGILLLFIGIIAFAVGAAMVSEANEVISGYETLGGEFVRWLSAEDEQNYNNALAQRDTGTLIQGFGGLLAFIGFIVLIIGLVISEEKATQTSNQQPTVQNVYYQQSGSPQQPYQQSYQQSQSPQQQNSYQQPAQSSQEQTQKSKNKQLQTRYCFSCGKGIPIDSNICPYCGINQPPISSS